MRILQKKPYSTPSGIMVNLADRLYRRRGKEVIPSYSYLPDELYCLIIKQKGDKVILEGLNPLLQNREELRRLCYVLKNGFPTPRENGEWLIYHVEMCSDYSWEELIEKTDGAGNRYMLNTLKWVDVVVERVKKKRLIDVQESLKQGKTVLYARK